MEDDLRQVRIYQVTIIPVGTLNELRPREPHRAYFSNLTKTLNCLLAALAAQGWSTSINYSAVYRSLRTRGNFSRDFRVAHNRVFRVVITQQPLNPALTTLGLDEMP